MPTAEGMDDALTDGISGFANNLRTHFLACSCIFFVNLHFIETNSSR